MLPDGGLPVFDNCTMTCLGTLPTIAEPLPFARTPARYLSLCRFDAEPLSATSYIVVNGVDCPTPQESIANEPRLYLNVKSLLTFPVDGGSCGSPEPSPVTSTSLIDRSFQYMIGPSHL